MKIDLLCVGLLTIALAIGGCSPDAAAPPTDLVVTSGAAPTSQQECLLAGAEVYEGLTERAFAEPLAKLASDAREAEIVARGCERFLNPEQIASLHQAFESIDRAQTPSAYALAAIEGYRVLVSAQARGASIVPMEVSLLDYAGFRYQAGASSTPPLWDDMRQAATIADLHWASIAPSISDLTLKDRFAREVAALHAAIPVRDVAAARRAATAELDDVDRLEQYFSSRTHQ